MTTNNAVGRGKSRPKGRWAAAIRRLLDEKGVTQSELAALAGVDKNTVSHLMRGDSTSTGTIEKLADALGVDVSELVLTEAQWRVLGMNRTRRSKDAFVSEIAAQVEGRVIKWLRSPGAPAPTPPGHRHGATARRHVERRSGMERRSGTDRRTRVLPRT